MMRAKTMVVPKTWAPRVIVTAACAGFVVAAMGWSQRAVDEQFVPRLTRAFDAHVDADARVAVIVVHEGERVFATARGLVGGEGPHAKEAITTAHLFDLGSISKSITAAAVLRLVEQKKLALDAELSKYFDKLPPAAKGVTVRHLLGHTAGLPPAGNLSEGAQTHRDSAAREILATRGSEPPGTAFAYSNLGYQLLAALVEKVAKRPFEAFVEQELFRRAGLSSATLVGGTAPKEKATWRISGERHSALEAFPSGFGRKGTTGVLMSAEDVARWDAALRSGKVLRPPSLDLWAKAGLGGYGFGWYVGATPGPGLRLHHTGSTEGYRSWLTRWPQHATCIVVLGDEEVDTGAIGRALELELFPVSSSDVGVQVAAVDRTDDGFTIEPGVEWRWVASDPDKPLHAFLPRERSGVAGAAVYCNVDREASRELSRGLRAALEKLSAAETDVHRVRVRARAEGLWAIARELAPFIDELGADAQTVRFGLRSSDGTRALEIEMSRGALERFVRALEAVL
jgi:CubicO group peptidase (beta-lactamase class C family)